MEVSTRLHLLTPACKQPYGILLRHLQRIVHIKVYLTLELGVRRSTHY